MTIKSVEFIDYVSVGPGRTTNRVVAESVVLLELCTLPAGVVIDGRLFVPMSNIRCIELLEGRGLGDAKKADAMLIKGGDSPLEKELVTTYEPEITSTGKPASSNGRGKARKERE